MSDAPDWQRLTAAELIGYVNRMQQGGFLTSARLSTIRQRATAYAYRDSDDTYNAPAMLAWAWRETQLRNAESGDAYERRKAAQAAKNRQIARAGQSLPGWQPVADEARRGRCRTSLREFCVEYMPETFYHAFSDDHDQVIGQAEKAVMRSGLFAVAMPRGNGKSAIIDATALWCLLYGHRKFIVLIGADETAANERLESIKSELEHNERLLDDFPRVCQPIRALEGIHSRTIRDPDGRIIDQQFTSKGIVLPTVAGSEASGGVVRVCGLTGRIRGLAHKLPNGKQVRPELAIIDDPQTDESAKSASQCAERERIISGAVLGLAGPDKTISALLPCTVIRPGDLADILMDRERHPEWDSARCKLIYDLPSNKRLWEQYEDIQRNGEGDVYTRQENATAFYRANRKAMDEGARVAWPERYDRDKQISAIQYAMDWKYRDPEAFASEAQAQPLADDQHGVGLDPKEIAQRLSGVRRGQVPIEHDALTAAIDVQGDSLFWVVCSWDAATFSGNVVSYGVWPEQPEQWFSVGRLSNPLSHKYPDAGSLEAQIYAGLKDLTDLICGREWKGYGEDNSNYYTLQRCLIDAQWAKSEAVVYQVCRASNFGSVLLPSHGIGIGPSSIPMNDRKKKPGETKGHNWIRKTRGKAGPHVEIDTNYWKSFVADRLTAPLGSPGALALSGRRFNDHQHYAAQLVSEYRVATEGRGRTVDVWKLRPGEENHWFDCTVNSAVAASMVGVTMPHAIPAAPRKTGRPIKLSERQRALR